MGIKRPEGAVDVQTQLKREFVASYMFTQIIKNLPKGSSYRGLNVMKKLRREWNKDFAFDSINRQATNDLIDVLPNSADFDKPKALLSDNKNMNHVIKTALADYDVYAGDSRSPKYPFSVLDPYLNETGVIPADVKQLILLTESNTIYDLGEPNGAGLGTIDSTNVLSKKGDVLYTATVDQINPTYLDTLDVEPEVESASDGLTDDERDVQNMFREEEGAREDARIAALNNIVDEQEHETYVGWETTLDETGEIKQAGLDLLLGAYLSKSQQRVARNKIKADTVYSGKVARNAQYLLNHLRGNGIEFELDEFAQDNTLNVKLNINRFNVNVLDTRAGYQGSVYDGYARYYLNGNRQDYTSEMEFSEQDITAPLDFLMGLRSGDPIKTANKGNSQIKNVEGLRKDAQIFVYADDEKLLSRWETLQFRKAHTNDEGQYEFIDDVDAARDYVLAGIMAGEEYFIQEMNENALYEKIVNDEYSMNDAYSFDDRIREKQEAVLHDVPLLLDMKDIAQLDDTMYNTLKDSLKSVDLDDVDLPSLPDDPQMVAGALINRVRIDVVGTYVEGFNPAFAIEHIPEMENRGNSRDAMLKAIQVIDYDLDKLKGNDFAVSKTKDRLLQFDTESAKTIDEVEHPFLKEKMARIQNQLVDLGVIGETKEDLPTVLIDDNGIVEWSGKRRMSKGRKGKGQDAYSKEGMISGHIGQIFAPDQYGILKTKFNGSEDFGFIPGYTGYFAMDSESMKLDDPTERFRVKGFEQHLNQQIDSLVRHQILRPVRNSWGNIPDEFDATKLNQIYTKDAYGSRVDVDYMETTNMRPEVAEAVVKTLSNRVRFDNQYNEHATTFAEDGSDRDAAHEDEAAFSYWKAAGEENMRVISNQWQNTVDMNLTGNARNQGIARYLVDGAEVLGDGRVKKANVFGEPDQTAMMKLDYFDYKDYTAWDRTQMSGHQLQTAEHVAEKTNVMFASFGGWTFEDGFVVSKEFAEKYEVKGEHGKRPLTRGDKISDFGGNKGVIGIVIDPDMDPEEARAQGLEKEVAWMNQNRHVEVVAGPYSFLSRHNPGILKEAMENSSNAIDPETGDVLTNAVGQVNIIVTDLTVTKKTNAYTEDDIAEGKGRKASGQLAWGLQSKGADTIMRDIYGFNDAPWESLGEYLMTTGIEMTNTGTLGLIENGGLDEDRYKFGVSEFSDASDFLNSVQDKGGDLQLPFDLKFMTGEKTDQLPILSSKLRKDTELVDGQLRRSQINNYYGQLFDVLAEYQAETVSTKDKTKYKQENLSDDELLARVQNERHEKAQQIFNQIQGEVIDRQFSGKHSIIREKIMGRRMPNSATGVAIPDPRREIGEMGMDKAMREALGVKAGDVIMGWRDPVWRDGAIRAFTVVDDEEAHGVSINPATAKSHDGDFDGDTFGLIKLDSKEAERELFEKFGHGVNMLDHGAGIDENGQYPLYFGHEELDLASANAKLKAKGDHTMDERLRSARTNAHSSNHKVQKKALSDMGSYLKYGFTNSHGADYIDLTYRDTIEQSLTNIVEHGAKGSMSKLDGCMAYFDGKRNNENREDAMGIMKAKATQIDYTGLAGAIEQKLVAATRNQDIKSATELGYLPTQMTLQIKHDPEEAKVIGGLLNNEIPRLYRGLDPKDSKNKTPLTKQKWVKHFEELYGDELGLNFNKEYVEHLAETLSENNRMKNIKEVLADKASPMDRIAYGGEFSEMVNVARKGESLLDGVKSKQFAPLSMQYAEDVVVMSKRDSIDAKRQEMIAAKLAVKPRTAQAVASSEPSDTLAL